MVMEVLLGVPLMVLVILLYMVMDGFTSHIIEIAFGFDEEPMLCTTKDDG